MNETELTNRIKAVKTNIQKQYAEEKVKRMQPTEPTKYRTDDGANHWKYADHIWIEELDGNGEGNENYKRVSKAKYFEMCEQGLIIDFEELGLYQP